MPSEEKEEILKKKKWREWQIGLERRCDKYTNRQRKSNICIIGKPKEYQTCKGTK